MNCREYREWVAADVDGILEAEGDLVRVHVESCSGCQALRSETSEIRALLRSRALRREAPFGLRTRILASMDEQEQRAVARSSWARACRWAAVAFAALAVISVLPPRGGDSVDPMIESYYLALRGELPMSIRTSQIEELSKFYEQRHDADVLSHVLDLRSAGFELKGGVLREIAGTWVRLSLYSDGENWIVCDYRRAGTFSGELPEGTGPLLFSRAGLTFCVTRVGEGICVLVTRMPMHEIVPRLVRAA